MSRQTFYKILFVIVVISGILGFTGVLSAQGRSQEALEHVKAVQERNAERLIAIQDIEGTAVGLNQNGDLAVKVFTARRGVAGIPKTLEGVPVEVVVTGKIYARLDPWDRFPRPVPTGVSTGHPDITAGTIGCRVVDGGGNVYALSNNHVYANENRASIGDNVLQPGKYDGGINPVDKIGTLYDFEPIVLGWTGLNNIDAAIAETTTSLLGNSTPSDGYGTPSSTTADAYPGQIVKKYGRTTKLTEGEVTGINGIFLIRYSRSFAIFYDQISIEPGDFSDGGDSGSLIVTKLGNYPVGLLFAGSDTMTIANPIDPVLDRFGVTVDGSTQGSVSPPVVEFMGNPTSGNAPLTVNFTDLSSGNLSSWSWNFGDGISSTTQNPSHTYTSAGVYTVSLTATNSGGSDTETKTNYITVNVPGAEATTVSVASISYATQGGKNHDRNLFITIALVDDLGSAVSGASVSIQLWNLTTFQLWFGSGTTASDGTATFNLKNAPSGTYITEMDSVFADGLTWDGYTPSNSFTK